MRTTCRTQTHPRVGTRPNRPKRARYLARFSGSRAPDQVADRPHADRPDARRLELLPAGVSAVEAALEIALMGGVGRDRRELLAALRGVADQVARARAEAGEPRAVVRDARPFCEAQRVGVEVVERWNAFLLELGDEGAQEGPEALQA